jgi:uncharacterized membrane protein
MRAMPDNPETPATPKKDTDTLFLVLAYIGPLGLIPYLTADGNDYIKWHARQGLTLTGVWIVASVVFNTIARLPGLRWAFATLAPLISLAFIAIVVVAIMKAVAGERWRIPFVADIADKW